MIFSSEGLSPASITPLDDYGASPPPYWNPKYAIAGDATNKRSK